ncbi:hypothetical protein BDB00DRAFT_867727 [Zychaea mexicana]|uniref:uncharacterized protein n=1 Tax=Zychaea mexicana TaxID=64656 RepID=UPI0022FF3CAC|nr:uncharacterized protein BDB00DRAFT_867727 [Zychaea mexicana]KAI9498074.1 hypothetical protein BDB00DRAFT_867727 [Zychaea mexicana]
MSNAELDANTSSTVNHDKAKKDVQEEFSTETHNAATTTTTTKKEWSTEEEDEEEEEYHRGNSSSTTTVTTVATSSSDNDDKESQHEEQQQHQNQEEEDEFGEFDEEFATPIDADDDDFGDFDDFQETTNLEPPFEDEDEFTAFDTSAATVTTADPPAPTEAEEYVKALEAATQPAAEYVEQFFRRIWTKDVLLQEEPMVSSPSPIEEKEPTSDNSVLCTQCSHDLWDKLSRDSVFYNSITGAIGQFQWTRSETNRSYLNALGVTINYEEKLSPGGNSNSPMGGSKRPQSNYLDTKSSTRSASVVAGGAAGGPAASAAASMNKRSPNQHTRSASLSGVGIPTANGRRAGGDADITKPPVEEEPELDIDIAKAYCELTEETIRIFPDEKLKSMVVELTRLQRQASEYLGYLLDQREQLMMDAETYNDLISCIVGHAQRLREQNVAKDASPAMVSKKKKAGGGGLKMLRRKQNSASQAAFSTSMGGGVVGVKQGGANAPSGQKKTGSTAPIAAGTAEGRRSM